MAERLESVPNTVEIGVWDGNVSPGLAETRLAAALDEARAAFDRIGVAAVFYVEAESSDGVRSATALGAVRPCNPIAWAEFRASAVASVNKAIRRIAADPRENRASRKR